jgi:hypothetical protein
MMNLSTTAVRRGLAVAAALAVPVGLAVLYRMPPTEGSFYPHCVFHQLTGLHCPGCGATRCLYALVHGRLAEAASYNIVFLALLPLVLTWLGWLWVNALLGRPLPVLRVPPWVFRALLLLMIAFWILRNLPYPPFTLLAPHPLTAG